jgi:hypothetical protein
MRKKINNKLGGLCYGIYIWLVHQNRMRATRYRYLTRGTYKETAWRSRRWWISSGSSPHLGILVCLQFISLNIWYMDILVCVLVYDYIRIFIETSRVKLNWCHELIPFLLSNVYLESFISWLDNIFIETFGFKFTDCHELYLFVVKCAGS